MKWKQEEWDRQAVAIEPCFQGVHHPGAEIRYIPEAPVSRRIIGTWVQHFIRRHMIGVLVLGKLQPCHRLGASQSRLPEDLLGMSEQQDRLCGRRRRVLYNPPLITQRQVRVRHMQHQLNSVISSSYIVLRHKKMLFSIIIAKKSTVLE